jgi:tRNA(adenine34) deaminase
MLKPPSSDDHFMLEALKMTTYCDQYKEIPVGAIIVCNDKIIAKAHNQTEQLTDATAHAEMIALTSAFNYLGSKYLNECTMYVTLEPCVMCAGALYWSQLGRLVYSLDDEKRGYSMLKKSILHPKTKVRKGLLAKKSEVLLDGFFRKLRN